MTDGPRRYAAVALAASLKADACELYTDVSGLFNADPRLVPNARRIPRIHFHQLPATCPSGRP